MATVEAKFGERGELHPDEIEITLTMRGKVDQVVGALISGLPKDALAKLAEGIGTVVEEKNAAAAKNL